MSADNVPQVPKAPTVPAESAAGRLWTWITKHPVVTATLALASGLSTAIPLVNDIQPFEEVFGFARPYYGLYTGEALLPFVRLNEGLHPIFSLKGQYSGDAKFVATVGNRCHWTIIVDGKPVVVGGTSCFISLDDILSVLKSSGNFPLTLTAETYTSRRLANPDGIDHWSINVSNLSPGQTPPATQPFEEATSNSPASQPVPPPKKSAVEETPSPQDLGAIVAALGNTQDSERYLRLSDQMPKIAGSARALTADDVLRLLDGVRDQRLRLDAMEHWFLPRLSLPLSIADAKVLLLGLSGADRDELLVQIAPCIQAAGSKETRDALLDGEMGDQWKDDDQALQTRSKGCSIGPSSGRNSSAAAKE